MTLLTAPAPHRTGRPDTGRLMRQVLYACSPAALALTWAFGPGALLNGLWCVLLALLLEAGCLHLRGKPVRSFLADGSAAVTGLLLGLALPAFVPWWLSLIGMVFAIPVAKHLYGGLGSNPFNPAMIGYALLLVSFPVEMTRWATPGTPASLMTAWSAFAGLPVPDALTGATPLDRFRTAAPAGLAPDWHGWALVNLGWLAGGLYLLGRRIIAWRIPAGFLAMLGLLSGLGWLLGDARHHASPLLHLFSGATMMGAFFIATDPVSAATTPTGRLVYGAGIGTLVYVIRTWGGYPDAVAFAVLVMNLAAPTLDQLFPPRPFGHDMRPVRWRQAAGKERT